MLYKNTHTHTQTDFKFSLQRYNCVENLEKHPTLMNPGDHMVAN